MQVLTVTNVEDETTTTTQNFENNSKNRLIAGFHLYEKYIWMGVFFIVAVPLWIVAGFVPYMRYYDSRIRLVVFHSIA